MAHIKMPVTPRSAYDPKRPANALLLAQVRELENALSTAGRRVVRKKPKTEEQVAAYIRHLNRALHHQLLLPEMARRPLNVPLEGESPTPRSQARARSTRRTAKTAATATRKRKKPVRKRSSSSARRRSGRS